MWRWWGRGGGTAAVNSGEECSGGGGGGGVGDSIRICIHKKTDYPIKSCNIKNIQHTFSSLSSNNILSSSSALAFCSLITVVKENILDDKKNFPT